MPIPSILSMPLVVHATMWAVPALFACAALWAALLFAGDGRRAGQNENGSADGSHASIGGKRKDRDTQAWGIAQASAVAAMLIAACAFAGGIVTGGVASVTGESVQGGLDLPGAVMLMLIGFLGWIILRFSNRYLAGETGRDRYLVMLLATLTAVAVLIVARHLGMLLLAWVLGSMALHRLLVFYPERRPAQIAAHKKFLVSRLAELCFAAALLLIWQATGSLSIDVLAAHIRQAGADSAALQWAAALIAMTVILKSAQLPLHGWLIQVMEAPTPVSALLHAGVVNIGGFVLIRLAFLIEAAPVARLLLLVAGTLTAVLAGMVMMTRISIKVRLAWSTCAQMGYLLLECGLGLWDLALLHLVAHSLYKAHAFLSAGEAARDAMQAAVQAERAATTEGRTRGAKALLQRLLALPLATLAVVVLAVIVERVAWTPPLSPVVVALLAISLAPLLWHAGGPVGIGLVGGLLRVACVAGLALLWHALFAAILPAGPMPGAWLGLIPVLGLLALYLLQAAMLAFPDHAASRRLYRSAYGGFALDERFTRLAFLMWPVPTLPPLTPHPHGARP